jgi:hypothetical protein
MMLVCQQIAKSPIIIVIHLILILINIGVNIAYIIL